MEKRKTLKDLNLLDRFLFAEAMEDPEIARNILEILLGREIGLKFPPQSEKEQRTSPLVRFIKLDVWVQDEEDSIYDTEVQKENTKNIPKRSRLYQALIDVKLLEPGEEDFNALNRVYVIIIMPFDLFGKGLYQYTFTNTCHEVPGMELEDGATRIFFNTHGKNAKDMRPEVLELLRYMEHTTEEVGDECESPRMKDLQKRIQAIKSSEEIGVKYMQAWEEKLYARQEGREEGRREERISLICKKLKKGWDEEKITELLEEDEDFVKQVCEIAGKHAPEYDVEQILQELAGKHQE